MFSANTYRCRNTDATLTHKRSPSFTVSARMHLGKCLCLCECMFLCVSACVYVYVSARPYVYAPM